METPSFISRPLTHTLGLALLCAAGSGAARATTYIWNGTDTPLGVTNWSQAFNWSTDQAPTSSADTDIIFGALASSLDTTASNEDIASPFTLDSLSFNSSAPAYTITGGALSVGAFGFSTSSASTETINNAVTFEPIGNSTTAQWTFLNAGALNFGGGVAIGGNAVTVYATGTGNILGGAISGTGSLTKVGTGTLALTGTNTYTGGTMVTGGTLVESNNGNALSTGTVAIGSGAIVALSNTSTSTTVSQAGAITFSGAGTLQKLGAGTVQLGGNGGTVNVSLGAGGLIDVEAGTLKGSSSNQGNYANNLGGLNIAAGATFDGVEGTIRVDALTGAGTLQGGYNNGTAGSTTIGVNNGSGTFSGVIQNSGDLGGILTLIKVGTGTQTLSGNNTYSGTTTISAGTLQVGSGSTSGSLGTNMGTITDNGALAYDRSDNISVANVISGSGGLTQLGTGTLTLTGASTYTGATNVNAGTLAVGTGGSFTGGDVNVGAGATLALSGTGSVSPGRNGLLVVDGTSANAANATLSGTGSLSAGRAFIGNSGAGTFTQSGGSFTATGGLALGSHSGSSGSYSLSGTGSLSAGPAFIGDQGTGTFTQSGGSFTTNGTSLYLGYIAGGSGTYTLSGGTLTTGTTQVSSDGNTSTFTQTGGVHTTGTLLLTGDATSSVGTYSLDGGTLNVGSVTSGGPFSNTVGTSTFHFNGGTLQAGASTTSFFAGLTTADVQAGGARIDTNGFNVAVAQALTSGTASGTPDGGLTKLGMGTLTLTGTNTYTGANTVQAGTLILQGGSSTGAGNAVGGTLQYSGVTLMPGYNTLTAGTNGTISYTGGTTVTGGYLSGSGTQSVGSGGASFLGTTIFDGPTFQVNAATSLTSVTSSGAINVGSGQTLTWTGGSNYLGSLVIDGTSNTSDWTSTGVITVNNGGVLANSVSSLVLGGGSRTTINSGGTLSTASGTTVELNGGLLTNNGTENGTLDVNYGSTANGSGTFGNVNVNTGGKFGNSSVAGGGTDQVGGFAVIRLTDSAGLAATRPFVGPQLSASPGTTNVGSLTLHGGGTFSIRVQNATGAAGTGYDLTNASGMLTLAGDASATNQIVIALSSLNSSGTPGAAANFNPAQNYQFVLVQAGGGIVGYTGSGEFDVDTTGFANALQGGSFSVVAQGDDLVLDFNAVPEPSTWALLPVGMGALVWGARRRGRA